MTHTQVLFLLLQKQPEQRSPEWYILRKNLITASSASSLLIKDYDTCNDYLNIYPDSNLKIDGNCCNPYSSRIDYLLDKCRSTPSVFKGNVATYWGQKYEPIVTTLYSLNHKTKVYEFGLLVHPQYTNKNNHVIGASPDGITEDGIMIEIKCPYRRKINGIPPFYYWIQVQLQLEVCNLEYCDFVEYEFTEYGTKLEFMDDITIEQPVLEKGLYIQIETIPDEQSRRVYIYPPENIYKNITELFKWVDNTIEDYIYKHNYNVIYATDSMLLCSANDLQNYNIINKFNIKIIYWKVHKRNIERIQRNRKWFNNIIKVLLKAHEDILYYKNNVNYNTLQIDSINKHNLNSKEKNNLNKCIV
jgi:putative phage-type endonuclease